MTTEDPFEAEQARRNQSIDEAEQKRMKALAAEEGDQTKATAEEHMRRAMEKHVREVLSDDPYVGTGGNPPIRSDSAYDILAPMRERIARKHQEEQEQRLKKDILAAFDIEESTVSASGLTREQMLQRWAEAEGQTNRLAAMRERARQIQEEAREAEEREEERRYPRIGGWQAGKSDQDLESMRFEIEADRALFLGKGAPPKADEKLRELHQQLSDLHLAYQKSGDPTLLIGIADLTATYQIALAKHQKRG